MNLRPISNCTCEPRCNCTALQKVRSYQSNDHVIRFLKGLNDSFATMRSQIMLINPLPSINKVFQWYFNMKRSLGLLLLSIIVLNQVSLVLRLSVIRMREVRIGIKRFEKLMDTISRVESAL